MLDTNHLFAVVLAGGGGTRLWPKSINNQPKQFLKLTSHQTMIQLTIERISKIVDLSRIIVITNKIYKQEIQNQLPMIQSKNIILEPEKRDTALAMLVGALYAKSIDSKAIIINSASDHIVTNQDLFIKTMIMAAKTASKNPYLVAVGITPTYPTSAFGYIQVGQKITDFDQTTGLYHVNSFREKPNIAVAQKFVDSGNYYWNANMYVWSTTQIIQSFQLHQPKIYQAITPLLSSSTDNFQKQLPAIYRQVASISIDYAISEKADNLVLIPGNFGWEDIGNWHVVYELGKKNKNKNVILSENYKPVITIDSKNNLIHSQKQLIALIGVENLIVVEANNSILIMPMSKNQEVKKIVEKLKEKKLESYL